MTTKTKIKIVDDSVLREEIDKLYEITDQVTIAKWSLAIAKHILYTVGIDYKSIDVIQEGFQVNEMWQSGQVKMHEVRQAGFKIHKLARDSEKEVHKSAFRVVGQAVSSGHMREHAMVASDYAVKVIGLMTENDFDAISEERKWQLKELKNLINNRVTL